MRLEGYWIRRYRGHKRQFNKKSEINNERQLLIDGRKKVQAAKRPKQQGCLSDINLS